MRIELAATAIISRTPLPCRASPEPENLHHGRGGVDVDQLSDQSPRR
jgi:hypothetical protein